MITKKDYFIRYGAYWTDLLLRLAMPIGITVWQFGLFKDEVGLFSRIQGTTIIGLLIAVWTAKDEIVEKLKEVENKGWYISAKRSFIWAILFGAVLWANNFTTEMLWVIGSFFVGSLPSNLLLPINHKYKNKINKEKEKGDL